MVYLSFIVALHSLSLLPSSGRDIFFLFIYLYIFFSTLQHNYTILHTLHNLPQIVYLTLVFLSLLVFILTHFLHIFKPFLGILFIVVLLPLCFASLSLCSFHSLGSSFSSQRISPSFLQVSVLALLGLVSLFELWQFLIANF